MRARLIGAIVVTLVMNTVARFPQDFSQARYRIGFGSCNGQKKPQPAWEGISRSGVDLWIWLGDNVYADTEDMSVMKQVYDEQFNRREYALFRAGVDIIGTWDDHDYGENNAGSWYPTKKESKELMLDFLEEPRQSARRSREGAFGAYEFGPEGRKIACILLDNRYFADRPGKAASLLGAAQWEFLRKQLATTSARLIFICSGTQIIPVDHQYEKWANFPAERERLLEEIRTSNKGGVILLSGDRHIHEISMINDAAVGYPLIEVTSSGLTHSYETLEKEKNRFRVGPFVNTPGFGMIAIDWDAPDPKVSFELRRADGSIVHVLRIALSMLQPNKDL